MADTDSTGINWSQAGKTPAKPATGPPASTPNPKDSGVLGQVGAGYHEELSSAYHAAKNISGVVDSAIRKVQRWTGKSPTWSKNYVTQAMEELEQHHKEAAEKAGAPHGTVQGLARSVGAAPVQIGEYAAAMAITRRPAAAMALVDASKEMDKGVGAAIKAGAGGYVAGKGLEYGSKLSVGKRIMANAGLGVGKALAEGQGAKGAVTEGLAQGAFGALPEPGEAPKLTPKERIDIVTGTAKPYLDTFKRTFAAGTLDEPAKRAAGDIRETLARGDLDRKRAYHVAESATKFFEKQPKDLNLQFFYGYEKGQVPPGMEDFAKTIKGLTDNMWEELNKRGLVNSYISNYIKHIYKDPDAAGKQLEAMVNARRPAQGSKGFSRERKYYTAELAKATAGLDLISDNPMDLVFAGLAESQKAINWHDIKQEEMAKGRMIKVRAGRPLPAGKEHFVPVETTDPTFAGYAPPSKDRPAGPLKISQYFAEPSVANIIKNHLAPGMQGNAFYNGVRNLGNQINGLQLGLSGRHALNTMLYSIAVNTQLAINDTMRGNLKGAVKGAARTASIVIPPLSATIKGSRVLKEALKSGSVGGETAEILDHYLEGGGRMGKDAAYQTQIKKQFNEMWAQGKIGRALFRDLPRVPVEYLSNIVMDKVVPTMKRGVAYQMLEKKLQELGPNATKEQWREAAGKIVDHMDNTMGEIVYDNRFIQRAWKDLGQILFRSIGFTGGTVSLFAGAAKDVVTKGPYKALRDSEKASFVAGLAITVGYLGAVRQMLYGQGFPKELKDYFYPRTGGVDANGNPERDHTSDYLTGDLASSVHDPKSWAINKVHPLISMVGESIRNRDWNGQQIRDPESPLLAQAGQQAQYVAKQALPISISQPLDQAEQEGEYSAKDFIKPQLGVNKAPLWISESKAERLASDLLSTGDSKPRSAGKMAEYRKEKEISRKIKKGQDVGPEIDEEVSSGRFGKQDVLNTVRGGQRSHLQVQVNRLEIEEALRVYQAATPEEQDQIRPLIYRKLRVVRNKSQNERDAIFKKFNEVMGPIEINQSTAPPPAQPSGINWGSAR